MHICLTGLVGLGWMLSVRYLLINRHRHKYVPIVDVEKKIDPGVPLKEAEKPTPWVSLFFKSAFW